MSATYQQIAQDYALWSEYADTDGNYTQEEFDAMSVEQKIALQVAAFGPEGQEENAE